MSGLPRVLRWLLRVAFIVVACAATVLLVRAFDSRNLPELEPWHRETLEWEFSAEDADEVDSVESYLARESRLFDELSEKLESRPESGASQRLSRFVQGSPSYPGRFDRNWNRSFESVPDEIRGAALLLHGLTDSPYSLRAVAALLKQQGYYAISLRMPGHGTHPGGLADVSYRDWQAVARIGARHAKAMAGEDEPFVIVGYSKGGALAVDYVLDALEDDELPVPDRVILLSPAIGVSPAGIVGSWHKALSFLPYFEKFRWLDVLPEYDPFKYNSFPKNAGRQMYLLTEVVSDGLARAHAEGRMEDFPATLSFQSAADRTVSTAAVIDPLYTSLASPRHALVLFGVNSFGMFDDFLSPECHGVVADLEASENLPYRLTLLTNLDANSQGVVARELGDRRGRPPEVATGLQWPREVYSLSHVAIPFPSDDMLYGGAPVQGGPLGFRIGTVQPRGERDLLSVSMNQIMRLRYNPFYSYLEERVREWLPDQGSGTAAAPSSGGL